MGLILGKEIEEDKIIESKMGKKCKRKECERHTNPKCTGDLCKDHCTTENNECKVKGHMYEPKEAIERHNLLWREIIKATIVNREAVIEYKKKIREDIISRKQIETIKNEMNGINRKLTKIEDDVRNLKKRITKIEEETEIKKIENKKIITENKREKEKKVKKKREGKRKKKSEEKVVEKEDEEEEEGEEEEGKEEDTND